VRRCVVCRLVRRLISRLIAVFVYFLLKDRHQSIQIQPMIWASTLKIWKHVNFGDFVFIILFVGILPFCAINLGAVSLFTGSPFTFLAMFVSDVIYRFE